MAEYIDKQALLNEIAELHMKHKLPDNEEMLFAESDIRGLVACLPTAEVEPVRHGRWIRLDAYKGVEQFKCSFCRSECDVPTCMDNPMYGYCPNCGARMDLGGADNG